MLILDEFDVGVWCVPKCCFTLGGRMETWYGFYTLLRLLTVHKVFATLFHKSMGVKNHIIIHHILNRSDVSGEAIEFQLLRS